MPPSLPTRRFAPAAMVPALLAPALLLSSGLLPALPGGLAIAPAQAGILNEPPAARTRAANMARMRAEALNGGLSVYRAASCMYDGGGACLIRRDGGGFLFRFQGGPPGWQQEQKPANRETEILISRDGRQVLEVLYNGPPRPTAAR